MLKIRVAVFALASLLAGSIPAVTSSVYILDENPPPAQIGVPYLGSAGYQFVAKGNTGEVSWQVKAADAGQTGLPSGMEISASGLLTGLPVVKGVYTFTVGCYDSGTATSDERPIRLIVADIYYVSQADGNDDAPGYGYSEAMPFATIERALSEASDGSFIYVARGVYGPVNCFDPSIGEGGGFLSVSLVATDGPGETFIDGDGDMCYNAADDGLVEGFTLCNGGGDFGSIAGGTLRRCVITGCVYKEVEISENEWSLAPVLAFCQLDHCTVAGNILDGDPAPLVSDDVTFEFTIFRGNSWAGDDVVDPRFANPALADFRLLEDSPYVEDGVATWGAFAVPAEYPPVYDPSSPCFAELKEWLFEKGLLPSILAEDVQTAEAARAKPAGCTHEAWEYFVAGSDPTAGNCVLRALISNVDGNPVVEWEPKLEGNEAARRVYTIWGAERFDAPDGEWIALQPESIPAMRFYRVSVRLTH